MGLEREDTYADRYHHPPRPHSPPPSPPSPPSPQASRRAAPREALSPVMVCRTWAMVPRGASN
eukprot:6092142-Pyramimonas_sp.AAC.1